MDLPALRGALLAWYRQHQRALPWRETRDPYAVWISEIMLQQTRVDTVIPYWSRFLETWPTVRALADAAPEDVRAAWSGLGYYRRAELMLRAARVIRDDHGGALPPSAEALRALPGFGAYTSGAVASIAFELPVPAVDGNVERVLARVGALEGTPREVRRGVDELAARLAPGESPGQWTQSLMELGATTCTPRSPRCAACPIAEHCLARARGLVERIPPPKTRAKARPVALDAIVLTRDGGRELGLVERPLGGWFGGLWTPVLSAPEDRAAALEALFDPSPPLQARGELTHVLTHRELRTAVFLAPDPAPREPSPIRWVASAELDRVGVPTYTVKLLRQALPELRGAALPGRRSRRRTPQLELVLPDPPHER